MNCKEVNNYSPMTSKSTIGLIKISILPSKYQKRARTESSLRLRVKSGFHITLFVGTMSALPGKTLGRARLPTPVLNVRKHQSLLPTEAKINKPLTVGTTRYFQQAPVPTILQSETKENSSLLTSFRTNHLNQFIPLIEEQPSQTFLTDLLTTKPSITQIITFLTAPPQKPSKKKEE